MQYDNTLNGYEEKYIGPYKGSMIRLITRGKGRPLICVSGWLGTAENFIPLINSLYDKFYCISIDLPGFGKSSPFLSEKSTIENYADTINYLIKELNLIDPIYFGVSLGASLGLFYLNKYDHIREVILQSPVYKPFPKWDPESEFGLQFIHKFPLITKFAFRLTKYNFMKYLAYFFGDSNVRSLSLKEFLNYGMPSLYRSSIQSLIDSIDDLLNSDFSSFLKNIDSQILLLYGNKEFLFDKKYQLDLQKDLSRCRYHVIGDGTHFLCIQKYEEIVEEINSFIE